MWDDPLFVYKVLDEVYRAHGPFTLVHGHCPNGADSAADSWGCWMRDARGIPIEIERHPADWKRYKKSAGYRRNAEMVKLGADFCILFILDESPGSTHTKDLAEKAGILTKIYRKTSPMNLPVKRVEDELVLRDIRMIYKNFAGRPGDYNAEGQRNFSVELTDAQAKVIRELGWNPKIIKRTAEEPEPTWHLKVNVSYREGTRPPRIFFITKSTNSRNPIDEEFVHHIDRGQFDRVDVTLNPYNHKMNGGGVTAYLRTAYLTLHEDPLDAEYAEYQLPGEEPERAIENSRRGPLELESNDHAEGVEIVEETDWEQDND